MDVIDEISRGGDSFEDFSEPSERAVYNTARDEALAAFDRDELIELIDETLVTLLKRGQSAAAGDYLAASFREWMVDATERRIP